MQQNRYKLNCKKPPLAALILLISFASNAAVVFTPGIPAIIKHFGIPESWGQLTVTVFIIGYALGQLIYAPLANRFGRKPIIYTGILIGFAGSILSGLSSLSDHFAFLIISRFIMAIGTSVGLVLTFTIINDFFYQQDARKIVPYTGISFSTLPFIFVMIGGFLVRYLGWASSFYFFACYCLLLLASSATLPETAHTLDPSATKIKHILKRYQTGFTNLHLFSFSTLAGCTTAFIYLFAAAAPLIVIEQFRVTPDVYGLLTLIVSAGYVIGNIFSAYISKYLSGLRSIQVGVVFVSLAMIIFAILSFSNLMNVYLFYLLFFLIYMGNPLIFTNSMVFATTEFHDKPTASAIASFINMAWGLIGTLSLGFFKTTPLFAYTTLNLVALFVLIVFAFIAPKIKKAP